MVTALAPVAMAARARMAYEYCILKIVFGWSIKCLERMMAKCRYWMS